MIYKAYVIKEKYIYFYSEQKIHRVLIINPREFALALFHHMIDSNQHRLTLSPEKTRLILLVSESPYATGV